MIVKPYISFLLLDSDAQLVKDINRIYTSMTGNPAYPKAVALVLLVKSALDAFVAALAAAGGGGTTLTAVKKDKRYALCTLTRSLAGDVTDECDGDLTVLLTSGFPIQKPQHFPIGNLPAPVAPTLSLGVNSGDLNAAVAPVYGAVTYNWQLALASAPSVILKTDETTAAGTSFSSLTPGQMYIVTVNAVGSAGTSDWSQPTSQIVV
ncbi:MAG TPA: hypothetical protein VIK59_09005 [Verrucomicrobiae bacterium]